MALSDADIRANYLPQGWSQIDEGEKAVCNRCSSVSTEPGTGEMSLRRLTNRAMSLPLTITLCERCAKALRYLD